MQPWPLIEITCLGGGVPKIVRVTAGLAANPLGMIAHRQVAAVSDRADDAIAVVQPAVRYTVDVSTKKT